jgi:hypothetical protein
MFCVVSMRCLAIVDTSHINAGVFGEGIVSIALHGDIKVFWIIESVALHAIYRRFSNSS